MYPSTSSAIVRKLGALALLTAEEVEFLEGLQTNKLNLKPGADFISQGEDFQATFLVRSGWAIRYILLPSGRRQILSYALPGDILGLHVNFRRKASYSAAALSKLELAAIEPLRMVEISQNYPVLASGISWCTAREFPVLGDQIVRLGRLSATKRVAHLFLELWHRLRLVGETDGNWLRMPMTQTDLADTLGLSIVHTNRQLAVLRRLGLIDRDGKWFKINDIQSLTDFAEFNPEHLAEFRT